ncbi:serine/threonine protein kinase [Coccidioides immitis RS]|uniref:Serine/threonine protein kinase n=1 Tax=Coccidioides immitis (strain RS) TaxID=246410 RepID=J3KEK4_COCIM|nr:serine/threonine protein kinase [Coccidioides immitis RS]EAS33926.3 serine/threonine protein kinase [Coccidioides immitis RS]
MPGFSHTHSLFTPILAAAITSQWDEKHQTGSTYLRHPFFTHTNTLLTTRFLLQALKCKQTNGLHLPGCSSYRYEHHLGCGSEAFVYQCGTHALKAPKILNLTLLDEKERRRAEYYNKGNREALEREKEVYKRVGRECDGVAECVDILDEGILLVCYKKGDLERYITEEKEVDESIKTTWILSAISTIHHLHHVSKVLVYDIALRNFLLTDDLLTLKMIDFGQASVFPPDTDITTANDDGTTVQVDIFHLGCIIYSIMLWQSYHNDLAHHDWVPPPIEDLPKLDGLGPWGEIIKKCWSCQYRSSKELHDEVLALFQPSTPNSLFARGWMSLILDLFSRMFWSSG